MLKTVKELCLVCGGERWVADPGDPAHSVACAYCDALGWVQVSLPSLGEAESDPSGGEAENPSAGPARKKP